MPLPSLSLRRVLGRMLSWDEVDDNFDRLEQRSGTNDTAAVAAQATANAALPKAGGTMTGVITYAAAQPRLILQSVKATTSGLSVDFTGIPSWATQITLSLSGVKTNGSNVMLVRLGAAGVYETAGYDGASGTFTNGASAGAGGLSVILQGSGFNLVGVAATSSAPSVDLHGSITFTQIEATTNTWIASGVMGRTDVPLCIYIGGCKSLAGPLDRLQIITSNGTISGPGVSTSTFNAGKANILYEGPPPVATVAG